jgi:hypothetical protein
MKEEKSILFARELIRIEFILANFILFIPVKKFEKLYNFLNE